MSPARQHRRRPSRRHARTVLPALATAALLAGCGSSKPAHTVSDLKDADCATATAGKVTLVAKNSRWDRSCVILAGTSVTFTIRNEDSGILHNLNVMQAPGTYKTDLEAGPKTQTLALHGLKPGTTYTYVCDLHPSMIGELRVR